MLTQFGAGVMFATPLYTASGAAIAIPSPVQFGILQDVNIENSAEVKMLYGANQYPVDIGRGKAAIKIKVKQAQVNAALFNSIYYGMTLAAGYNALYADQTGSVIPTGVGSTSVFVTPTAPFGGTSNMVADLGVQDGNGRPFTRVASAPTSGQYAITTGLPGYTYVFANQDVGTTVFISYQYNNATNPTTQKQIIVQNLTMGAVPTFSTQFYVNRNGHTYWRKFPNCVATKLGMDFKNDDFVVPEFEISCFADTLGNIEYNNFDI